MDLKYFILILFCGYLNDTIFSETEATTTENQPQSALLGSPIPYVSTNSQNTTGNPLGQPTQFNNVASEQLIQTATVTGQPTPAASSEKPAPHISAGQLPAYNITRQSTAMASASSPQMALPVFTSASQLPLSAHTPTRKLPPFIYTSTQQPLFIHTSSSKQVAPTIHNLATQQTPNVKSSPMFTPGFILQTTSSSKSPPKTKSNSTAAILVGIIMTSMLIAIIMIILWKCLRKPVLNDQNWAGRSPFADGETPDICSDNIRENEVPTKRTSIISLMAWKPSKSTVSADDLEIKLFESSENIEDSNNPKTEKMKDQANGTSEDSAGGSTIGTAISSSDDADLPPPPPPLLDLEGQESNQSDIMTLSLLPSDSTKLPSLDCLNQDSEDHNSEFQESFPPPPDSFNLPLAPEDFMKNQEDSNKETQCQFSIPLDSDQDLNESLPPPPEELL
ncbi:protein EVI2B [Manis javanica]|uniref:protein EVI2B n=1 Tax=Manis javanica TaxID=9974 RepID=UPI0008134CB8|nr:protein EVI2B [Manis javanica]